MIEHIRKRDIKQESRGLCCPSANDTKDGQRPFLAQAAKAFRALGDETRLAILALLRDRGRLCACEFLGCCSLSQPTLSHHLKVLREAGLVKAEKHGLWVHYSLNQAAVDELKRMLP